MIKVVFDTNVIVSAALNKNGIPALLLDLALNRKILMFHSQALMNEYEDVLKRKKFNFNLIKIKKALDEINRVSSEVIPTYTVNKIIKDPKDNIILEVSQEARADYIITGNTRHFSFPNFKNTKIVTPRKFLSIEGANLT